MGRVEGCCIDWYWSYDVIMFGSDSDMGKS